MSGTPRHRSIPAISSSTRTVTGTLFTHNTRPRGASLVAPKDTWLKVASGIWILSALGAAIALTKGVHIADVIESVGALWILLAMLCCKRIAVLFPNHRTEIAFGLAMIATAL